MPSLAIRLPDDNKAVANIVRHRFVTVHNKPQQLGPNAIVAFVGSKGLVRLVGRVFKVVGPMSVRLLNGNMWAKGYRLELRGLRALNGERRLPIRWRAVGQFRYFDARGWSAVIVGPLSDVGGGEYLDDGAESGPAKLPSLPFAGGIPGLSKNDPEATLVREYVAWLRAADEFQHHFLRAEGLHTDLFDRRYWRLIEAKNGCDRRILRAAVGQLLDYKRWYPRKPSLGVLLSTKPSSACRRFLTHYGVAAIWRTPSGRFADSTENRSWSSTRRVDTV